MSSRLTTKQILKEYPANLRAAALKLPKEVLERQVFYWSPLHLKLADFPPDESDPLFDASRLVYRSKDKFSRCQTWAAALKTGIAKQEEGKWGNGWRKCHTENYWCYYARYLPGESDRRQVLQQQNEKILNDSKKA